MKQGTMVALKLISVATFAVFWPLQYCSAFHIVSHAASRHATDRRRLLQKLYLYRGDANGDHQTRTGFDLWDSPHVAGGNSAIGGTANSPGPRLWQYAYHANWAEVLTRVVQNPQEAKYIRDNGWTTLHLLVAGNANPVPLEVVRAVYEAYPAALNMRTNDYNRTPREIAERWKQRQDIIDFLSNPDKAITIDLPDTNGIDDDVDDTMESAFDGNAKIDDDASVDSGPNSGSIPGTNNTPTCTYSTQTPPIMSNVASSTGSTDRVHEYQQQQPPWMTGGKNSSANRHSKPLTADAIVITSLQSQHNNFLKNQVSELKRINEDLAQTLHTDIDKIATLEAENIELKESGAQTRSQLEEALQRMKDMERALEQKYQTEVDRRVNEAKVKLQADADRRLHEVQATMQEEANRKISEVQTSKSSNESTSNDTDFSAMKQKLQTTHAELLSLKEELENAKILEEQMRNSVVMANSEAESLIKARDEALKAKQNIKVEIASANTRAEEAHRRFLLLEEQAKKARNKLSADIESLKKQYNAKLSHLKKELRRLEEEKEENRCSALASNDKARNIQKRLNVLEEKAKNDEAQIMSLKDAVEVSKKSKEQMRTSVESANAEFREALKRWEGLESQVGNLAASERSLLAQVERLRLQLREKQM